MRRGVAGLVLSLLLAACGDQPTIVGGPPPEATTATGGLGAIVTIRTDRGSVSLSLDVARTPEERARGLAGVRHLPEDGGMLFLFEGPTTAAFWMKDTLLPLSIAFVDEDGRILAILDMPPCRKDPCPTYRAPEAYVTAIEVKRGTFERLGVEVGDVVDYELRGA